MRFPGGVADPLLGRAYVRDRVGVVSAVDLDTGRVRWKSGPGLRPIAVAPGATVVVARPGPGRLEIVVIGADDGAERMRTTVALPDWARPALADTADFGLSAAVTDDRLLLGWTARGGYQGGAAPSAARLAADEREAGGTVEIDLRDGGIAESTSPPPDDGAPPVGATSGADVLDAARVGAHRYELAGTTRGPLVLRAVDDRTHTTRWEVPLDAGPSRAPRPPRP